jgi:hypothetical protein
MGTKADLFLQDSERQVDHGVLCIVGYLTLGLPQCYALQPESEGTLHQMQWVEKERQKLPDDFDLLRAARLQNWQRGITVPVPWWNLMAWKLTPEMVEIYGESPVHDWLKVTLNLSHPQLAEWLLTPPALSQPAPPKVKTKREKKPIVVDLNERQREYLRLIYEQDQENEYFAKEGWFTGWSMGPASEWRWIPYNTNNLNIKMRNTTLKDALKVHNLVNSGTGSTLVALQERGLIELRGRKPMWTQYTDIKLTRKGRALCRQLWPDYKYSSW